MDIAWPSSISQESNMFYCTHLRNKVSVRREKKLNEQKRK